MKYCNSQFLKIRLNLPPFRRRRVRIQCFPVYTVLLALGNPTVHYFSLDIEGAELQVRVKLSSPLSTVRKDRISFFNAQEIEQRAHVKASVFSATR